MAQLVKNLSSVQEIQVRSLGQKDAPGEGKGYPLLYSCLENSMDRGAWWAVVHSIAKSRTRLKRLSTHACTRALEEGTEGPKSAPSLLSWSF